MIFSKTLWSCSITLKGIVMQVKSQVELLPFTAVKTCMCFTIQIPISLTLGLFVRLDFLASLMFQANPIFNATSRENCKNPSFLSFYHVKIVKGHFMGIMLWKRTVSLNKCHPTDLFL